MAKKLISIENTQPKNDSKDNTTKDLNTKTPEDRFPECVKEMKKL